MNKLLILLLILSAGLHAYAQSGAQDNRIQHFSGTISLTNNGISVIPSFSLGRPAAIFELSAGGEKLSFEPQFRFALEGKPWSFVFWFRYNLFENEKFRLRIGAHPAFLFNTVTLTDDGTPVEVIKTSRFIAGDIAPSFRLTKKISINPYYLMGHGFDPGVHNSHYLSLITSFSNLEITRHLRFNITPQIFFLKMDKDHGYYFASSFSVGDDRFPVSIGAMFNQKIRSAIPSKDFLWNVSLIYSFSNQFKKQQADKS